nr:MAG TPA: hypothetical protein [Caudoviricetes sp.]
MTDSIFVSRLNRLSDRTGEGHPPRSAVLSK